MLKFAFRQLEYALAIAERGSLAIRPISEDVEKGVIALATLRSHRQTRLISTFEEFCVSFFRKMHSGEK